MNLNTVYLLSLLSLALIVTPAANADTDCVFDPAAAELPPVLHTGQVSTYDWSEADRTARGVLHDGSLFSARYWACNHIGARVVLLVDEATGLGVQDLRARIKAAAAFLPEEEALIVTAHVDDKNDLELREYERAALPMSGYSEFYLGYGLVSESVLIEVMYYFD